MSRVLIVEDSAFMRRRIIAMVEAAGFEVLSAADGVEGLEATLEHRPDCVLSDLLMPQMNGTEMIEALRENGWTGPVAVLTADIQTSTRRRCEELGVVAFLNKPPRPEQLAEALSFLHDGGAKEPA